MHPVAPLLLLALASQAAAPASPPTANHIVIVIEENHAFSQVIGSPSAPYLNSLAASGASFTSFFAITHPSQPNYLHLFAGDNQGVTGDSLPTGFPWSTPNLGAAVIAAGRTFATYSEDLPAVGSNVSSALAYVRRHNPGANWQAAVPALNQIPLSTNRPFFLPGSPPVPFYGDAAFPTDFSSLPTVCLVVPNLNNDMHDGTIAQADAWLAANIAPYATWAQSHNSLLIITFDEDNSAAEGNRIPTIFYGPMIDPSAPSAGTAATWTLHNLLRTVGDMAGAAPSGAAAQVRPITGVFAGEEPLTTNRFQQGVAPYSGCIDTFIESANPTTSHAADTLLVCDGSPLSQGLIRFESIFGHAPNQVPAGATIASAKLLLHTGSGASDLSASSMRLHRMLAPWSAASTWSSLSSGITANGAEAAVTPDFSLIANILNVWVIVDATDAVQTWSLAPSSNLGWAIIPSGTDGWRWLSSESSDPALRPILEITWITSSVCPADWNSDHIINPTDIALFVSDWVASLAALTLDADFDRNGTTEPADIASFVNAWFEALAGPCGT